MTLPNLLFLFGALLLLIGILGGGFAVKEVQIPRVPVSIRLLTSILGTTCIVIAIWSPPSPLPDPLDSLQQIADMTPPEQGVDLLGSDYASYPLEMEDSEICRQACKDDSKCKAWTYVKPGIKGPEAMCFLKNAIPPHRENSCCISGSKKTVSSN